MGDNEAKSDQDAPIDLRQERYRDLFSLLGKRIVWLFVKLISWKMILWVATVYLTAMDVVEWWGFFLISIFVFGLRSFEKLIEKGLIGK